MQAFRGKSPRKETLVSGWFSRVQMPNDTLTALQVPVPAKLVSAQASEGFPPRDHRLLLLALGTGVDKNIGMIEKSKRGRGRLNCIPMETFLGWG